jgi:hypothetical protein
MDKQYICLNLTTTTTLLPCRRITGANTEHNCRQRRRDMKPGGMSLCTHQFAPAPRRFVWGPPKLEARRQPSRKTTGDSLSPTPLLSSSLCLRSLSLSPPPSLSSRPPSPPRLAARVPIPLHLSRRRIPPRLAAAARSSSESPGSVVFLGRHSFRRREAPCGAPRRFGLL